MVLSGFIKEKGSKELLIGASIAFPKYKTGTTSNAYGFYSISLPADTFEVIVSYVGFAPKAYRIDLQNGDVELNIEMDEVVDVLREFHKKREARANNAELVGNPRMKKRSNFETEE